MDVPKCCGLVVSAASRTGKLFFAGRAMGGRRALKNDANSALDYP